MSAGIEKGRQPAPIAVSSVETVLSAGLAGLPREVVAVALTHRGRIGLFKRSALVHFDQGLWHVVTGFVDAPETPLASAVREIHEEAGLSIADLISIEAGPVLELPDQCDRAWRVHTFTAATRKRRLALNWEHDGYRWVAPRRVARFDGQVRWLRDVLGALSLNEGAGHTTGPSGLVGRQP